MATADDYAKMLSTRDFDPGKLRLFAEHLADFEARSRFRPKDVLVNGLPPFPEMVAATFDIPKDAVGGVINDLLSRPEFNPNIIINGFPANEFLQVTVGLNR